MTRGGVQIRMTLSEKRTVSRDPNKLLVGVQIRMKRSEQRILPRDLNK